MKSEDYTRKEMIKDVVHLCLLIGGPVLIGSGSYGLGSFFCLLLLWSIWKTS